MSGRKSIRINTISRASIITISFVAVLLIVVLIQTGRGVSRIRYSATEYQVCQKAAADLESASAYLTEQAQLFVISGDIRNMELYFTEVDETKRRENAVSALEGYFSGTEALELLRSALDRSVDLMNTEYHAMRLAAEAYGMDMALLDERIQGYPLSDEELHISDGERLDRARALISDSQYQEARGTITHDANECMEKILATAKQQESSAVSIFHNAYLTLRISVALLVMIVLWVSAALWQVIVKPLEKYGRRVKAGETLPLEGAFELQQLAETYNGVYEENRENQRLLRHEADHDSLTKAFNRRAFDRLLSLYESGDTDYALIIIDVDNFKTFNDTYGHSTGDRVLQRVATVVKDHFRSMDYVCRIGGDEFAVIMVEVQEGHKGVICEKLKAIGACLASPSEGIPPITLSIGAALSGRKGSRGGIFSDADSALYEVKENGRNGYRFHSGD